VNIKSKKNEICSAYRRILLREPDENGLQDYLNSSLSIDEIEKRLKNSVEYKNRVEPFLAGLASFKGRKILLFGAYGNGNLGDAIQADFILEGLREAGFDGGVWATSFLDGYYHFSGNGKLPTWAINSIELLDYFDLIIVGGGGLLSHPHHPLNNKQWAESLKTPLALLSVGATNYAALDSELLIKKAIFVSARDDVSLSCLSQFRRGVKLLKDPVLCMQDYSYNQNTREPEKTAWILRGPASAELNHVRRLIKEDDVVVCFEKKIDQDIEGQFPELVYTPTVASLRKILNECSRVVSMRYHGLILALPHVEEVYGLGDQKNQSLLSDLKMSECYIKNMTDLGARIRKKELNRLDRSLVMSYKDNFVDHLKVLIFG